MQDGTIPETPQDLQHPGRLATDKAAQDAAAQAATSPGVRAGHLANEDDTPIFDDPVIGWWENAWSLREDQATPL